MRNVLLLITLICCAFFFGCTYSLRMNQYPHLRNVLVMPFDNKTLEIDLDERLRDGLISSFQRDGRLRIVYEDPDSSIEGEIIDYKDEIFGYDVDDTVEEYIVTIRFKVTFTDLVRNEIIWENNNVILSERYAPAGMGTVDYTSETEAQDAIIEDLFSRIIRNSLESW